MPEYNPFDKPLSEVESSDIYGLDVPEGYYCEYKRGMIERSKLAKAISSFANTYGGLLFLGIEEDSNTNKPGDWFTLSGGQPSQYKETVRNTISSYLSRSPRFSTYSFSGTSQSGEDGYVIMVEVPESRNTPHIHNDGCVYRRTGEGSDPYTALNDPGVLDELHQRRMQWKERAERFCQTDLGFTSMYTGDPEQGIEGIPMLELYGVPTTLDDQVCSDVLIDLDRFKDVVESSDMFVFPEDSEVAQEEIEADMGINADSYRATSSAAVAQKWAVRDEEGEIDESHTPLTIKFFSDGAARFFIPVSTLRAETLDDYSLARLALEEDLDLTNPQLHLIDGPNIVVTIYNMLNLYLNLLEEYDWPKESNDIYLNSRFVNGYRTLLFFDADWYRELVQNYGPPVCYDQTVEFPRTDPFQYNLALSRDNWLVSVMGGVSVILQSMGLPLQERDGVVDSFMDEIFDEFSG